MNSRKSEPANTRVGRMRRLPGPILVLLGCLLVTNTYPDSKSAQYKEYEVKAAFMYNFLKFADWPKEITTDGNEPIIIGVIGKDPLGEAFKPIEDKSVKGRKVVIKRFKGPDCFSADFNLPASHNNTSSPLALQTAKLTPNLFVLPPNFVRASSNKKTEDLS